MAFTLFDLMLGAAKKVGIARVSYSSGGSSVTLIDSRITQGADGDYTNGTIFLIDSVGVGLTGQFREISGYTVGTFTFSSVASTITNPTLYAYTTPEYSNPLIVELANDALRSVGMLVYTDRAMQSSAAQTVYSLSSGFKHTPPLRVDVLGNVASSANAPEWVQTSDWEYQPSAAGSAGAIQLGFYPPATRDIRVWYETTHPRVSVSTAAIDERIHPELAVASLVDKMYEYRNSLNRGSVAFDLQRWNDAQTKLAQAKMDYPIWRPRRKPKLVLAGDTEGDHLPYPPPYGP